MTMADDDLSPEDQAAAETLMQELLDGGFKYERNGRVAGFAGIVDDEPTGDELTDDELTGDEPTDDEPTGDEPTGDEPPADEPTGDEPTGRGAHSGRLELRGTPLTEYEADGLLHLRKLLIDHPDLATQFNDLAAAKLQGRPAPAAPAEGPSADAPVDGPPEPKLPEFVDPDDPVAVGMWHEIVELKKGQKDTASVVTTAVEDAGRARVQADIGAALDRFKSAHPDLDDNDIRAIRDHTSATVNIPGVMANFPGDAVEGLVRALEIGSMTDPATRDKVLGVKDDRTKKDTERKRALSALSGGGGSGRGRAPKETKPTGWNDVSAKLADAISKLN